MLSPVSTWMGDRLGTLGAVGILFHVEMLFLINLQEYIFLGITFLRKYQFFGRLTYYAYVTGNIE